MSILKSVYVPELEPRMKHPTVFKNFDALQNGEGILLINDHDPKPLYYQLLAERGKVFSWNYVEKGPNQWQVEIKKQAAGQTVGEIAAADVRKAEVFKTYGIDFCCGGHKTLEEACKAVQADPAVVEAALANSGNLTVVAPVFNFDRWAPDFLADYIYNQHHQYYYTEGPIIADLLQKVVAQHGQRHPELNTIVFLYRKLQQELRTHFVKEERVLFPFIKALVHAKNTGDMTLLKTYPAINGPVQMMQADHDAAGDLLAQIRKAANNYTPPADGCNSFRLVYQKLQELEADLHQHIHLENNILFPKAQALEKEIRN